MLAKKVKKSLRAFVAFFINRLFQVPDFRTRGLPVLSPVASMYGMALVTYIVTQLAEFTAYTLPTSKMRDSVFIRLQKDVASKEEYVYGNT